VVVALLHAFWDASAGIAVWLTLLLTNTPSHWLSIDAGHTPTVTAVQVHTYSILNWGPAGVSRASPPVDLHLPLAPDNAVDQTRDGSGPDDTVEHAQRNAATAHNPHSNGAEISRTEG
jgi:hypothetical protein